MKRVFLSLLMLVFLGFTGCGGGGSSNPQPQMPASAANMSAAQQKELQAQFAALQTKFAAAQAACNSAFGPTVNAVMQQQQNVLLPPMSNDACFSAVQQFLLTFKTTWNGQYANTPEGQNYQMQAAQAFLSSFAPGQTMSPSAVASLAFPTFNQFMSTLDPSMQSSLGAAASPYLGSVNLTGVSTTTTTTGIPAVTQVGTTGYPGVNVGGTMISGVNGTISGLPTLPSGYSTLPAGSYSYAGAMSPFTSGLTGIPTTATATGYQSYQDPGFGDFQVVY